MKAGLTPERLVRRSQRGPCETPGSGLVLDPANTPTSWSIAETTPDKTAPRRRQPSHREGESPFSAGKGSGDTALARMNKQQQAECVEWVQLHRCCAICWWPESDGRRALHVHHICGGPARKHDIRNYCRLCSRCHEVLHSGRLAGNYPDLNNSAVLWAKQESDPDNFDPDFLASLRHRKWLGYDPEPPDQWYLDERQTNLSKARKP